MSLELLLTIWVGGQIQTSTPYPIPHPALTGLRQSKSWWKMGTRTKSEAKSIHSYYLGINCDFLNRWMDLFFTVFNFSNGLLVMTHAPNGAK